jgi:hypothetical protein
MPSTHTRLVLWFTLSTLPLPEKGEEGEKREEEGWY